MKIHIHTYFLIYILLVWVFFVCLFVCLKFRSYTQKLWYASNFDWELVRATEMILAWYLHSKLTGLIFKWKTQDKVRFPSLYIYMINSLNLERLNQTMKILRILLRSPIKFCGKSVLGMIQTPSQTEIYILHIHQLLYKVNSLEDHCLWLL